jgi:hypothetical protein
LSNAINSAAVTANGPFERLVRKLIGVGHDKDLAYTVGVR